MAEFDGIFCCPFPLSVLIIEGVGGMGSRMGWDGEGCVGWEVAKTTPWDTTLAAMMPTQWPMKHQWAT